MKQADHEYFRSMETVRDCWQTDTRQFVIPQHQWALAELAALRNKFMAFPSLHADPEPEDYHYQI